MIDSNPDHDDPDFGTSKIAGLYSTLSLCRTNVDDIDKEPNQAQV